MRRSSLNPKKESKSTSLLGVEPRAVLASVLNRVGVGVVVIDNQRKFVFTNQAALNLLGMSKNSSVAELRRKNYKLHDSQGHEIPPGQGPLSRALEGEEVKPGEIRLTFPDGRKEWLHVAAHPFSIMGLTGVFAVVADETEEVELRKALERSQRMGEIGTLAGGLAHDFNNVLSALSENVALALTDEGVPQITRSRLLEMQTALKKGAALTQRLMRYSRAQDIQMAPLEINDVVNAAIDLTRPLFKSRVHVKTELSDGLPFLQGDFARLEQVMINLIVNALDAMPEGGELTIHTELVSGDSLSPGRGQAVVFRKGGAKAVSFAKSKPKEFVLVSVADTGIGIPTQLQTQIFEPFFSTKPSGKGTGLGLSIAQTIVRQHKGDIKLQSTQGSGTTFRIYLPVAKASSSTTKPAS